MGRWNFDGFLCWVTADVWPLVLVERCWKAALLLHDSEVALHKQLHSFITMEINLNVYQSQSLFFGEGNLYIAFQWQKIAQIWWKMCTHSIFYASVIWEPSDEHKLEKCMVKASFIKAKIITKQSALGDLKHNFHLVHILHFSHLSLSVPGSPHLGTIIRLISR